MPTQEPAGHQRRRLAAGALIVAGHLLAAVALAAAPVRASAPPLGARPPAAPATEVPATEVLLAVTHARVPSAAFHTARDVSIWVPDHAVDGPSAGVRYPVLIFPDAEEKGQFRSALANVQFLVDRQLIPPVLVVGVPYLANRRHELSPAATGSTAKNYPMAGGADTTLRFIADELLPWIDAHYPTLPTRLLAGHSLGGLFALYAMVTRPDLFRVVIAMSPVLAWNDGAFAAEAAARLAADTVRPRTLFLTSGGLEPSIDEPTSAFAARLSALLDTTRGARLRFERRRYPRDTHEMTPLPGLVDGLRMAFEPLLVPTDSAVAALAARHAQDPAEIRATAERLKAGYARAAASLGLPATFPEVPLDILGGYSLQANQSSLAVSLLRENRDRYPRSSNTHESLGEALAAAGDTAAAVGELRTALTIATAALEKPGSVVTRARERDVKAAAIAQLRALGHAPAP